MLFQVCQRKKKSFFVCSTFFCNRNCMPAQHRCSGEKSVHFIGHVKKYMYYRTRDIITRSWFETADFIEEFPCLVHKLSVILTALDYKPQWKNGVYWRVYGIHFLMLAYCSSGFAPLIPTYFISPLVKKL